MPALHHYQERNPRLGTPSGLCRERSLRAYDGVVNVVGNPSPTLSGFPKPLPTGWSKRVSAATSFYAAYRPLFRQVGRWCTGIPCATRRIAAAITKSGRVSLQLRVLRLMEDN